MSRLFHGDFTLPPFSVKKNGLPVEIKIILLIFCLISAAVLYDTVQANGECNLNSVLQLNL